MTKIDSDLPIHSAAFRSESERMTKQGCTTIGKICARLDVQGNWEVYGEKVLLNSDQKLKKGEWWCPYFKTQTKGGKTTTFARIIRPPELLGAAWELGRIERLAAAPAIDTAISLHTHMVEFDADADAARSLATKRDSQLEGFQLLPEGASNSWYAREGLERAMTTESLDMETYMDGFNAGIAVARACLGNFSAQGRLRSNNNSGHRERDTDCPRLKAIILKWIHGQKKPQSGTFLRAVKEGQVNNLNYDNGKIHALGEQRGWRESTLKKNWGSMRDEAQAHSTHSPVND
ncbi:MAG: hypothetical protein P8J87_03240 [Verrucomicrobiales bacterium]|nr:hypothetical protein [Verrucomicrobiales bacterium]